jgi:HEAT repeat protein
MWRGHALVCVCAVGVAAAVAEPRAQEPSRPQAVAPAELQGALDQLGSLEYGTRMNASRLVRRTEVNQAVPALRRTLTTHKDGFVRYRALVLLTGFNDPQTAGVMREALNSPNDRLRGVAYEYFEANPNPSMVPMLLTALENERSEFVRPSLVRALAALGADPRVQKALVGEAGRGEDFFRSAVIEALGEFKALYAHDAIAAVAKLDGPLQDDAALALGRIGDKRALEILAGLQRTAEQSRQPAIAAAICLLGVNCEKHESYLIDTLKFADSNTGFQELLRGAAGALGALALSGRREPLEALLAVGIPSRDPSRAPIALAVATVALRNTPLATSVLEKHPQQRDAIRLVADGFDMLEEDLIKERFFALVRRSYWAAAEGSESRALMQTLIGTLDF